MRILCLFGIDPDPDGARARVLPFDRNFAAPLHAK
jgi:hypothetical protein